MSMNTRNSQTVTWVALIIIVLFASFLRLYKIDQVPPSLSWDEAAVGYNAYTIANWGRDEWGNTFPLYFKSFEDDKHPVHVYATVIAVKILGLSEFSTRLPAALFGIFNVVLLFFLGKIFFKSNLTGILAALFLAISPMGIQFSRFNHELNFVLFFFLLGLLLFYLSFQQRWLLILSFLSFGIDLLSYHPAKIIVPPILLLLLAMNFKEIAGSRKIFLVSCAVLGFFIGIILLNPALLGFARASQTKISDSEIYKTKLYQVTKNNVLGLFEVVGDHYIRHFTPQYLFISGDKNPKFSTQQTGMFYKIDALFLAVGFLALLIKRSKISYLLLAWGLIAPIPSSLTVEAPHSARAVFMVGSLHLISAFGMYTILNLVKKPQLKWGTGILLISVLGWFFVNHIGYYFGEYAKKYAIDWQYGMKQLAEYADEYNGYTKVYVTDIRSQPYIFFLYYLKTPFPDLLQTVKYNTESSRSYNLVSSFDRYNFGGWDEIKSSPEPGILYMVGPSVYDGLEHKNTFDVKNRIKYPSGLDAFFLVSYP